MNELAKAIFDELSIPDQYRNYIDVDFIAGCIRQHQDQYPGSWQNWKFDDRKKAMMKMMRDAINKHELSPARIVMFFG